jgi:hypothetical protein
MRPDLAPEQKAILDATARLLANSLGERRPYPRYSIKRLVRAYGEEFVREYVERAQTVEAAGGLLQEDGRRRTLGGVFFWLVKQAVGMDAYREAVPMSFKAFRRMLRELAAKEMAAA